jgi:hypothetical protein
MREVPLTVLVDRELVERKKPTHSKVLFMEES